MSDERRRKRREMRLQQSESVWLQKALFALNKAEAAHEKLADEREEEAPPYALRVGDQELPVEELQDAIQQRAEELLKSVREARREAR